MKRNVVILIDALHSEGAENVAVAIATSLKHSQRYEPIVCVTRWGGPLERVLDAQGVRTVTLGRRHTYEVYRFRRLRLLIKEENVALIHAHKVGSNFWGAVLGKVCGTPVILHFHGRARGGRRATVMAARLAGRWSRKIIAISDYERRRLIDEEGLAEDKIVTIYNGIDLGQYYRTPVPGKRAEAGIAEDARVVGIVAAFRPEKNHGNFLRAAAEIAMRHSDAFFLLVGDGAERAAMEHTADELGIAARCRFTGFRTDVPDLVSTMDVGVLSSHWEGLPLALLEYMASAKPVVSTNVGGVMEVVQEGRSGILVPPDDSGALAAGISRVLEDPALRRRLGERGLEIAKERFSQEAMVRRIEALYDATLALNGRVAAQG